MLSTTSNSTSSPSNSHYFSQTYSLQLIQQGSKLTPCISSQKGVYYLEPNPDHEHGLTELGKGSLGIILKASFCPTKQKPNLSFLANKVHDVALKLIKSDNYGKNAAEKELSILKDLKQKWEENKEKQQDFPIVKVLEDFTVEIDEETPRYCCIVLEQLKGPTFFNFIQRSIQLEKILSLDLIAQIGLNALKGIAFIHQCGYIHNDIKPENIMLNQPANFKVKIIDFGLSDSFENTKELIKIVQGYLATRYYRPPEFIQETDKNVSEKSDMWSFGCVLFELYAKRPLFYIQLNNQDKNAIISKTAQDLLSNSNSKKNIPEEQEDISVIYERNRRTTVSEKLRELHSLFFKDKQNHLKQALKSSTTPEKLDLFIDLISKLLEKDPEQRFSAQQALSHSFFKNTSEK